MGGAVDGEAENLQYVLLRNYQGSKLMDFDLQEL